MCKQVERVDIEPLCSPAFASSRNASVAVAFTLAGRPLLATMALMVLNVLSTSWSAAPPLCADSQECDESTA